MANGGYRCCFFLLTKQILRLSSFLKAAGGVTGCLKRNRFLTVKNARKPHWGPVDIIRKRWNYRRITIARRTQQRHYPDNNLKHDLLERKLSQQHYHNNYHGTDTIPTTTWKCPPTKHDLLERRPNGTFPTNYPKFLTAHLFLKVVLQPKLLFVL